MNSCSLCGKDLANKKQIFRASLGWVHVQCDRRLSRSSIRNAGLIMWYSSAKSFLRRRLRVIFSPLRHALRQANA
jgi:hypothetical protein